MTKVELLRRLGLFQPTSFKLEGSGKLVSASKGRTNHRTLESIATDLAYFRSWLEEEEIDFLVITPRARARPT